jgi:hypothetical protein
MQFVVYSNVVILSNAALCIPVQTQLKRQDKNNNFIQT